MAELTPEQTSVTVSALYNQLTVTRHYLSGYQRDTTVLPDHDDCCSKHQRWIARRRSEREALEAQEELVLGALSVLDPAGKDAR